MHVSKLRVKTKNWKVLIFILKAVFDFNENHEIDQLSFFFRGLDYFCCIQGR